MFAGALINTFIFVGHYGTLTRMLTFSENIAGRVPYSVIIVNLVAIAVLIVAATFAIKYKFSGILQVISGICCISLFAAGIFYTKSIKADYEKIASTYNPENAEEVKPVLHLSKDKQNVVLFMLDRSESAYLSSILEEDPSLKDIFTGKIVLNEDSRNEEIIKLLKKREYLFLHFPDGYQLNLSQDFLNRIRVQIDFFLKILK